MMPKLTTIDLTRRESQIMEILYRRRRATVEEIRSELPDAPSPSSVRKLLDMTSAPLTPAEYRRLKTLMKRVRDEGDER